MNDNKKSKEDLIKELQELRRRIADLETAEIERMRPEEELRESELQLRFLSDNLRDGVVYQIDSGEDGQQRRFSYISAGVERLHGITVGEALKNAMTIYDQVIAEDRLRLTEDEAFAAANMVPFSTEVRLRLPSGELRWRFFTSAPRRLHNNHLIWDGIEIDITDRNARRGGISTASKKSFTARSPLTVKAPELVQVPYSLISCNFILMLASIVLGSQDVNGYRAGGVTLHALVGSKR